MAKRIVITSGKGGVGKTTVTAFLGSMLASMGERVVMIDEDFGLNNLDVVTGLENRIVYDMGDVLSGRCRTKQALVQDVTKKNLYLMPSGRLKATSGVSGQEIKLIIENLSPLFDYVLIDSPAGLDVGFHRAVSCADQAIVVATPNLTSLRDADKAVTVLSSYKLDYVGLVVNRARGDLMASEKMMKPTDIATLLKTDLIGVLPEEDVMLMAGGSEIPKMSESKRAYKILANNIIKGTRKTYDVCGKYTGFWGSIRRSIKKSI